MRRARWGMDIFTIDDGWQKDYGENAVNLTAFPGGLQPIEDAVEAHGMRLGLWIPMAAIGYLYRRFIASTPSGRRWTRTENQDHLYSGGAEGCDVHGQRLSGVRRGPHYRRH